MFLGKMTLLQQTRSILYVTTILQICLLGANASMHIFTLYLSNYVKFNEICTGNRASTVLILVRIPYKMTLVPAVMELPIAIEGMGGNCMYKMV